MKNRLLFILAAVFFTAFSGFCWAQIESGIKSPVGSGTVPPSSLRSGLIRSSTPVDTSGNLIISGNVAGGKHFRGIVPYRASSDFGAVLGSTSLDSFLRRSAGSGDFGRFKPYYSPTGTVTTTRPGRSAVFGPATAKIGDRAADRFAFSALPKVEGLSGSESALSFRRLRPMAMTLQEMEEVVSSEVGKYPRGGKLTAVRKDYLGEQRQTQRDDAHFVTSHKMGLERFQRDIKQISDRAAELEQSLIIEKDDSLRPSITKTPSKDVPQWFEMQTPEEQSSEARGLDVYEQMKWQIDYLQKGFVRKDSAGEQPPATRRAEEAADDQEELRAKRSQVDLSAAGSHFVKKLQEPQRQRRAALGLHKTFARLSEDRFNQHIRAAENYLKQGKYYRAADAYTLASIYKPGDPLAYAGKSHALLAAGEYMSSALFLSRALEIFPEYARFKIDIEAMVGDKDKLESRITNVEQWLERSDAAELQFLLAYVYYQMGRLEQAKGAIDAAYEKMPDRPKAGSVQSGASFWGAVIAIKKAIDESQQ